MIEVKELIPEGTIVEFTEFDDSSHHKAYEEKELVIGSHYLTSEIESIFSEMGLILVIGKSGDPILLKESQYRVVRSVQKSIAMVSTDLYLGTKNNSFYEIDCFDMDSRFGGNSGVAVFIHVPSSKSSGINRTHEVAMIDSEVLLIIKKGA